MSGAAAILRSRYPVQFGEVSLVLYAYEVQGRTELTERVTADSLPAVTASFPKGTRLTLRGSLPAAADAAAVTAVLAQYLQAGTAQDILLGTLRFASARLCGYTVSGENGTVKAQLQFYCPSVPVEEVTA